MSFPAKEWNDGRVPGGTLVATPLDAAAMNNLEDRITFGVITAAAAGFQVVDQGTITTSRTLDMSARTEVLWLVKIAANNLTLSITGWGTGKAVTLRVMQDATGNRTGLTLPSAKWEGGSAPVPTTTANSIDVRSFFYDGVNVLGFESGTAMA